MDHITGGKCRVIILYCSFCRGRILYEAPASENIFCPRHIFLFSFVSGLFLFEGSWICGTHERAESYVFIYGEQGGDRKVFINLSDPDKPGAFVSNIFQIKKTQNHVDSNSI